MLGLTGLIFDITSSQKLLTERKIQYIPDSSKGLIGDTIKNKISQKTINDKGLNQVKNGKTKIVKRLRPNDVYYLKTHKGNNIVIFDIGGYYEIIKNLSNNGPYMKFTKKPATKNDFRSQKQSRKMQNSDTKDETKFSYCGFIHFKIVLFTLKFIVQVNLSDPTYK